MGENFLSNKHSLLFNMHNMLFTYLFYDDQFIRFSQRLIMRVNAMFKLTTSYFITFDIIDVNNYKRIYFDLLMACVVYILKAFSACNARL